MAGSVPLRFYNTLTNREEEFSPLEENLVRMYSCGPTVYDYAHIGNYRTFVFQDVLRRHMKARGYRLFHVMNVTDVDDKTIRNAKAAGVSLREYTDRYTAAFFEDSEKLRLEKPEKIVRATDHIAEMVELIRKLEEKGLTYRSDGSIYYRINAFPGYGKLSKIDMSGMMPGARVDVEEYEKEHPSDFALWKAAKEGEPSWETPLGPGRPGWHVECSAMSMKYLGDSFDVHTGGSDLVFPHHENEIAQSEGATGKPFVRFWLHCEHLIVDGKKMSKSLGNFYTLRDLLAQGHAPEAVRYLLASVPYRKQLNFTFDGLRQAAASIDRLRNFRLRLQTERFPQGQNPEMDLLILRAANEFGVSLDDDLNTAAALGAVFETVREMNTAADRGQLTAGNAAAGLGLLERFDGIFAVLRTEAERQQARDLTGLSAEVDEKLRQRAAARQARDFATADRIRRELLDRGVIIEDTKEGVRWKLKS
jgi:cysteinyl-tRNA synthetase